MCKHSKLYWYLDHLTAGSRVMSAGILLIVFFMFNPTLHPVPGMLLSTSIAGLPLSIHLTQ